jgi:hypothetical protein
MDLAKLSVYCGYRTVFSFYLKILMEHDACSCFSVFLNRHQSLITKEPSTSRRRMPEKILRKQEDPCRNSLLMSAGLWLSDFRTTFRPTINIKLCSLFQHSLITKYNETLQNSVCIADTSLYGYLTYKIRKRAFSSKSIADTDAPVPQQPAYVIPLFLIVSNINWPPDGRRTKMTRKSHCLFSWISFDFTITDIFASTIMAKQVTAPNVTPILTNFTVNVVPRHLPKAAS